MIGCVCVVIVWPDGVVVVVVCAGVPVEGSPK